MWSRSLAQEANNFVGDELGRRHDCHMPLAAQDGDPRVRKGGANPLGSLARPVGALLAEKEERRSGDSLVCQVGAVPPYTRRVASYANADRR